MAPIDTDVIAGRLAVVSVPNANALGHDIVIAGGETEGWGQWGPTEEPGVACFRMHNVRETRIESAPWSYVRGPGPHRGPRDPRDSLQTLPQHDAGWVRLADMIDDGKGGRHAACLLPDGHSIAILGEGGSFQSMGPRCAWAALTPPLGMGSVSSLMRVSSRLLIAIGERGAQLYHCDDNRWLPLAAGADEYREKIDKMTFYFGASETAVLLP